MVSIMMYYKNLFEMLSSMTENKSSTKSDSHFSPKKTLMQQMGNLDQIAPNLCNSDLTIHSIDICEMLTSILGVQ